MNTIAIITARGGSKRIPKKNIKKFCGKPIIAYSIEAALKSGVFDTVMVSTDCEEIADVAKEYGAEIPFFRSVETSNDFATTVDVLIEVINEYSKLGIIYENFFCIYPTAPFITAAKLVNAMDILKNESCDSVFPVVKFSFPPQRGMIINDIHLRFQYPHNINTRSQDLEPVYHDCGQFYAIKTKAFLAYRKLVTDNTIPLVFAETEVQDIDDETDWKLAEIKYQMMIDKKIFI